MRKFVLWILMVVCSTALQAAPPSDASIDTLFEVTRTKQMVDAMVGNLDGVMGQAMQAATKGQPLTAQQKRAMDEAAVRLQKVMREELSWAKMRPLYVQIYKESLTQEELDGMIAFYRSPAGVAMLEKMPVIMQKSMNIMQARMPALMEKIGSAMREAVDAAKTSP